MKSVLEVRDLVTRISAKQEEQRRLIKTLEFYAWLEERGVDYKRVVGITNPIELRDPLRIKLSVGSLVGNDLKNWGRRTGREAEVKAAFYAMNIKLDDDTEVILPWPPYDDNVIFNRQVGHDVDDRSAEGE